MPNEETVPIPLEYIDVTGSAHSDLDVMQEKKSIDDYRNVDSEVCRILEKDSQNSLLK